MPDPIEVEQRRREERTRAEAQNEEFGVPPRRSYFRTHPRAKWILLLVLIVLVAAGWFVWDYYSMRESTDDAQLDAHVTPISAKVGGPVTAVHVSDNQQVEANAVLVQIDRRDFHVALLRAQADLDAAVSAARAAEAGIPITSTTAASRLSTAEANLRAALAGQTAAQKEVDVANAQLSAAGAKLREAEARSRLAEQNLARMKQLVAKDEISRQQFDAAVADAEAAQATVDSARAAVAQAEQAIQVAQTHVAQASAGVAQAQAGVSGARTGPQEVTASKAQSGSAQARVEQFRAAVAQAELNLEYTTVRAPVSGVVSNKTVQVGQVIQQGQPLMAVVPLDTVWITANFKETQLNHMHPGQPAEVSVDAYGGRKYRGHVDSISGATGSRFSLLPPENATGNYVKVVQRVPVKIVLEENQDPQHLLRPGMSVVVTVFTGR